MFISLLCGVYMFYNNLVNKAKTFNHFQENAIYASVDNISLGKEVHP